MVFYLIVFIIGIFITTYSMFDAISWSNLYFDRDYYCPEEYRKTQKTTDILSVFHNIVMMTVGFGVIIFGLQNLTTIFNIEKINDLVFPLIITLCFIDNILQIFISQRNKFEDIVNELAVKWKKEKRYSKSHNDEVNLYRGCKRIMWNYPWQATIGVIVITIIIFLI